MADRELKKSQSIIDFAIALIAVAALAVGIVRIWIWFNANYAKREVSYQASRIVAAGIAKGHSQPITSYNTNVDIGATEACPGCTYHPMDLTEEWVFKGVPRETVTGAPADEMPPGGLAAVCDNQCTAQCVDEADCQDLTCQDPPCELNRWCECYQACSAKCNCDSQIKTMLDINETQVSSLNSQASSLRGTAKTLLKAAEKCDDWWDGPCNWFGKGGKSAKELKRAAKELKKNAKGLEDSAKRLNRVSGQMQDCCSKETAVLQEQCLDGVEVETACEEKCLEETQDDTSYNVCYNLCIGAEGPPCNERVDNVVASIQTQIGSLKEHRGVLESLLEEINQVLPDCAASADSTCSANCTVCVKGSCSIDSKCYNHCYELERNLCCNKNCCRGFAGGWGRDCDVPAANCDAECSSPEGCPKCGLSKLASNVDKEIQGITTQISKLEQQILDLPGCCSLVKVEDQNKCIEDKVSQ